MGVKIDVPKIKAIRLIFYSDWSDCMAYPIHFNTVEAALCGHSGQHQKR